MTTTFETLCSKVEESFRTFTGGDTTVLFQRGRLALAEHQDQRRIVLIRPGGKGSNSSRVGSVDLGDGNRVRMVRRRSDRVEAHLYAETETAAEAMLDNLIASCDAALGTAFEKEFDYDWLTEGKQAAHTKYTEIIFLRMFWHKPVLDRAEPLTQVEAQGHACSFGDGDFDPADFSPNDFLTAGGEAA